MNKLSKIVWLKVIVTMLLVGCMPVIETTKQPEQKSTTFAPTPTTFSSLITTTNTPKATITAIPTETALTQTSMPVIPNAVQFKTQCLDILSNLPQDTVAIGTVVLKGFKDSLSYLLDMDTGIQSPLSQGNEELLIDFAVSASGKWLAYQRSINDTKELVITTADRSQLITIPWEENWLGIERWLDENRIVLWKTGLPTTSHVILNPFNGEQQEILDDYPDIDTSSWPPVWAPVYDPTLTRVVYPRTNGDEMNRQRIVLWDLQVNRAISYISSNQASIHGAYGGPPVWAEDGQGFIMALDEFINTLSSMELYRITRDGEATRLTNLTSYYYSILEISRYTWSPGERYVAFWLKYGWDSKFTNEELAVVDLQTLEVTNYCITSSFAGSALIWSPSGEQLVFGNLSEDGKQRRAILVDVVQGYAASIAIGDLEPVGWMASP